MGKRQTSESRTGKRQSGPLRWTAKNADKHLLYQEAVQDAPGDIKRIDRIFAKRNGRSPKRLREDFCGTALLCADWVRRGKERTAVGLDLDGATLTWAKKHNLAPLQDEAERVQLLQRNVLEATGLVYDVAVAFNFSYCVLMQRAEMLRYCKGVHSELSPEGVFFLDVHGGTELTAEGVDEIEHEGFTYLWDQGPFDAIGGTSTRYIHFKFPDGSELKRAFKYHWRLWNLQELQDILHEAGFSAVEVYWEGAHGDGSGNGRFRKVRKAVQEESWIAHLAAWK